MKKRHQPHRKKQRLERPAEGGPPAPCDTCRVGFCRKREGMIQQSIWAWGHRELMPSCDDWEADWYQGLEGVFA